MIIYPDSNILLAYWNPDDKWHDQCEKILKQPDFQFVISTYSIIEFESVIGRYWHEKLIDFDQIIKDHLRNLPESQQIRILTQLLLNKLPIQFVPVASLEKLTFNTQEYLVEGTLQLNFDLNAVLLLRTLDSLHIASAFKIKQYSKYDIDFFLTNDQNILKNKANLRRTVNIIPISSEELITMM